MAKKKDTDRAKDPAETGTDFARKIWLAGVGAYGKAFSETQENLSKMTKSSGKVFDDLVEKGENIETLVKAKGISVAKGTADKFGVTEFDDRIEKMRARLKRSLGDPFSGEEDNEDEGELDADSLSARLIRIEAKLDQLLAPAKPAAKPAAKRAASRKKPTARTSTAKKPATKAKATPKSKPKG